MVYYTDFSLISNDHGPEVVEIIKRAKLTGRGCQRQTAIYALAMCARSTESSTKKAAYSALQAVCPEPSDLLTFVMFCEMVSGGTGWGRAQRRAVSDWYNSFSDRPMELAEGVTKVQKNGQWTHKDVARLSHVKPDSPFIMLILRYVTKGLNESKKLPSPIDRDQAKQWQDILQYLEAVNNTRQCTGSMEVQGKIDIIRKYRLETSQMSAALMRSTLVWEVLLNQIPLDLVIQNISKIDQLDDQKTILERLGDVEQLQNANVNPFAVVLAMKETNDENVKKTLAQSFELCVRNVKPTDKKYSLVHWVGKELDSKLQEKNPVTIGDAIATMATIIARATHRDSEIVTYTSGEKIKLEFPSTDALACTNNLIAVNGSLSVLVQHVEEALDSFDAIIVLLSSPAEKFKQTFSRFHFGVGTTRLVIVNFASSDVTVEDPKNPFMLEVVGFSVNTTEAIMRFVEGH
ncbi:60 kDa SS-A/Ro ribonucleoprotein [Mizuhopecten yessoensis]|uniref:60 kDa SS-A/Ro ribonucleoprotein n=2 Tax=Mizuhopecten yessoensis TaxID=6573 RepID=A0A210PDJ1_MIZYE|nr:60 kDa SS-A/Ro ribonucleoprotein [Mizuhopecten yessoensis]